MYHLIIICLVKHLTSVISEATWNATNYCIVLNVILLTLNNIIVSYCIKCYYCIVSNIIIDSHSILHSQNQQLFIYFNITNISIRVSKKTMHIFFLETFAICYSQIFLMEVMMMMMVMMMAVRFP